MARKRTLKGVLDRLKGNGSANGRPPEPPPEEPWEAPLAINAMPDPDPFPLGALPGPLAEYVEQCAWATNSPADFVGVPLLGLAAGCLGASRALGITRDHVQPSTLFAVVVGLPGTGKSPALERVAEPLEDAERRHFDAWKVRLAEWREEDAKSRGPKPGPRRLLVDDTTTEALAKTLHANQRGALMVRDELSALIAGMNQYKEGKGNDRQMYLKIWSASTIRVDRKSNEDGLPLVIRRPSLSIVGGVQPDVVETFLQDDAGKRADDGFLDRFLFSFPRDLPAVEEQWRVVEPGVAERWDSCVRWLLSLEQWRDPERGLRAKIVRLTDCGRAAWVEFTRAHAAELNHPDFPDHLRGPWSKLRGYCGRLALVLHYLRMACDSLVEPDDVDGLSVKRAAELTSYFKGHYLRVAARMGADPRVEEAGKVLSWLRRNPAVGAFSRRDAYLPLRHSFQTPEDLDRPLALLVQHSYLRPQRTPEGEGPGRKPSPRWEVNPGWLRINSVHSVHSVTPEEDPG